MIGFKSVLVIFLALTGASEARQPRYYEEAREVKEALQEKILDIKGVTTIGLGACDERSGEVDDEGGVFCIIVTVESPAAAKRLAKYYPSGSEFNGIHFWIQVSGKTGPEPRMSGGR